MLVLRAHKDVFQFAIAIDDAGDYKSTDGTVSLAVFVYGNQRNTFGALLPEDAAVSSLRPVGRGRSASLQCKDCSYVFGSSRANHRRRALIRVRGGDISHA